MSKELIVNCPTCAKPVKWATDNQYRPFCCERCKLIDLGEWASEGHRIASESMEDDIFSADLEQDFFKDN